MKDSLFDLPGLVEPFLSADAVAVAVSGGPDSMALCHALARRGVNLHVLTVDHGLRAESAAEARQVGAWIAGWPGVRHDILTRDLAEKPGTKLQEDARHDRYALLAAYCAAHGIGHLFTAHHQDDQAETFLFRLAKGSGLDGLGAMRPVQNYKGRLQIIRPFLDVPKSALVAYCRTHDVPFVQDPSNDDERFARVRLRQSADVLAAEGLSAKRLSVTAARLARAREALDHYADDLYDRARLETGPGFMVFDFAMLRHAPDDIRLRVLGRALDTLGPARLYGPRMEKLEALALRLFGAAGFKRETLGGCLIRS